ncbi:MAG: nucleotidyltransferase family protein [Gallionella sp.]
MKALILAAGRGERMRPLTDHTPKPLLKVGDKPLIVWHIERLVAAGICELVINHAHLGEQIEAALGDGRQWGAQIQYSAEPRALETAGGIAQALPLLTRQNETTPFAVINGDIFCDYDFSRLPRLAAAMQRDTVHLVLVNNPPQHPKGDFYLYNDRIETRANLPANTPHAPLTFSGIGLYHLRIFKEIPQGDIVALAPLLRAQIAQRQASGEHHTGTWVDVGTPQRLQELDLQLNAIHKATHAKT